VIVADPKVVRQMVSVFEDDWAATESGRKAAKKAEKAKDEDAMPAAS
jgi:hypothetical protein